MTRLAMILSVWATLVLLVVFYLEAWQWTVAPFECGAKLLRFTRSPCLPDDIG